MIYRPSGWGQVHLLEELKHRRMLIRHIGIIEQIFDFKSINFIQVYFNSWFYESFIQNQETQEAAADFGVGPRGF